MADGFIVYSPQYTVSTELSMDINQIREKVDGIPHMVFSQGQKITDIILENRFQHILELGFRHGVSTCYMAGALDEMGSGHITTIDLENAQEASPNISDLLGDLGLEKYVDVCYDSISYNWRLMKMLEEDPTPRFDFCYLDGAHNWFTDGFAFFLVDKLLKPGGLIVFDDLDWSYASSPTWKNNEDVKRMSTDERNMPQVRKVFELLVQSHPSYGEFMERNGWAFARKLSETGKTAQVEIRKHVVYKKEYVGLGALILKIGRGLTKITGRLLLPRTKPTSPHTSVPQKTI